MKFSPKGLGRVAFACGLAFPTFVFSCSQSPNSSSVEVTDVTHSPVKRQSIGNCWLYATASWIESEHLAATGEEINTSESYWTWWHFYNKLVGSSTDVLQTGGSFGVARNIIMSHGYVLEGEFLPDEANAQMSNAQLRAETYIKAQMQNGGTLANRNQRTPENVRAELDRAFGSNMAQAEAISRPAQSLVVNVVNGRNVTLAEAFSFGQYGWQSVYFPHLYGQNTVEDANTATQRKTILQRVMRALNAKQPVIMTLMIDFNALDTTDATFKRSTLETAGAPGHQGGHLVVLEDYVVDDVPGVGTIGEGDTTPEMKELALQGKLRLLKAKNSWGTNRADRGLIDGYSRFDNAYLTSQLGWKDEEENPNSNLTYYTTLSDFTLPPGF